MIFSSPTFLFLFLPLVLAFHTILLGSSEKIRNFFLLVASLFFYSWGEPFYILFMLFSIAINHLFGWKIQNNITSEKDIRIILSIGVVANIALLGIFKYGGFFLDNINYALQVLNLTPLTSVDISLPLGISFFTFQSISYLIDVSRKTAPAQKNLFNTALYISFFPQLIAGPIVRYHQIAEQLTKRSISIDSFEYGVQRFVYGLGKKVLIANTLAEFVDYAFQLSPDNLTTSVAWLAVTAYALQIYYDFSGYSDMAIGLGHMFGFTFPENFNYPYASKSIKEFWRRWHITLSEWFRDYLYIPLGGSHGSSLATYRNLIVVFFLCGLWHGAAWTFIAWGLFHGVFLILERGLFGRVLKQLPTPLQHFYTILIVLIGWVLFRADTFPQAKLFIERMIGIGSATPDPYLSLRISYEFIAVFIVGILFSFPLYKFSQEKTFPILVHSGATIFILIITASKLATGTYNPFIYFRF